MSERTDKADLQVARAEAAAWLARLRSEERTAEDERGFRAWLAEGEHNREAFETTTAVFEMAGAADRSRLINRATPAVSRRNFLRAGVSLAAASVAGIAIYLRSGATYATDIGEQRKVSLEDGTLVSLDTNTEIRVSMSDERRTVKLRRGRAHFDVADDPARPFEVIAGGRSVLAARSHFDVSLNGVLVSVLVESGPLSTTQAGSTGGAQTPRVMMPGERLIFAEDQ
ncbi:MAG TPA: FecR domain-containing protein, partial [Povalibacter sp.]|nr:FecR domain-containing protein [Povalibacter sp.]